MKYIIIILMLSCVRLTVCDLTPQSFIQSDFACLVEDYVCLESVNELLKRNDSIITEQDISYMIDKLKEVKFDNEIFHFLLGYVKHKSKSLLQVTCGLMAILMADNFYKNNSINAGYGVESCFLITYLSVFAYYICFCLVRQHDQEMVKIEKINKLLLSKKYKTLFLDNIAQMWDTSNNKAEHLLH